MTSRQTGPESDRTDGGTVLGRSGALQEPFSHRARFADVAGTATALLDGRDQAAAWVATRQHALISAEQAALCGISRKAVRGRIARGLWREIQPGAYLIGSQLPSTHAEILAAVLSCGPFACAGGQSAAWTWGMIDRPSKVIEIVMTNRSHLERRGVQLVRPTAPVPVRWKDGLPLTTPLETLFMLAGSLSPDALEAACALAIRRGLANRRRLRSEVEASRPRPGISVLRSICVATGSPVLTRSDNERRLRALVGAAGLPQPESNVEVLGREVDFYWREAHLIVEVDAFGTHGGERSFENDRVRDSHMATGAIQSVRFTRRRLRTQPARVVAELAAVLALRGLGPAGTE